MFIIVPDRAGFRGRFSPYPTFAYLSSWRGCAGAGDATPHRFLVVAVVFAAVTHRLYARM
jgi:hypothetical protein